MTVHRRSIDRLKMETYRWEDTEDEDDAHAVFMRWASMIRDRPAAEERRKHNLLYASLYNNRPLAGFGPNSYTRSLGGAITLNVTQSAVDSLVAKVCKNRPRPMFTTTEAPFELREKMEAADKYVDGVFYRQKYYHTTFPGKVLDAALYGLGVTKVFEEDRECEIQRVYPWELILDERECMYGTPTRIGQRKWYDRQAVFDQWRRKEESAEDKEWNRDLDEAIESCSSTGWDDVDMDESTDQILVFEGWRAPTKNHPGKLIHCINGKTLSFLDVKGPCRFSFLRPEQPSMGFWGSGVVEKVANIQREINRIVQDIQRAMHLLAKPHWMVEASSNVLASSLNNDMATIIKYQGATPPQVYVPQAMSPEVYEHLQFLLKTVYEITGVSQLSAQSQKPGGLNTGVAIRTYLGVESERFNNFVRGTEESVAEDAYKAALVIGDLRKPKPVMSFDTKGRAAGKIEWQALDLEDITVQVYPASKMPDTPAGRREYGLELAQYGVAAPDDVYEILEWADTEAFAKRRLAGRRNVERDVLRIRKGENVVRDAIGDHAKALLIMSDSYEEAKLDGAPQRVLAPMREYIRACRGFLGMPPLPGEEVPPEPPMPGEAPPMGAMPPPMDPNAMPIPNEAPVGAPLEQPLPPGPPPPPPPVG